MKKKRKKESCGRGLRVSHLVHALGRRCHRSLSSRYADHIASRIDDRHEPLHQRKGPDSQQRINENKPKRFRYRYFFRFSFFYFSRHFFRASFNLSPPCSLSFPCVCVIVYKPIRERVGYDISCRAKSTEKVVLVLRSYFFHIAIKERG